MPTHPRKPFSASGTQEQRPVRLPRVMLFTDSLECGGTERQALAAAAGLDRRKYDVRLGCLHTWGPLLEEATRLGVPIIDFPLTTLHKPRTVKILLRLASYLREQQVDLVHAFGFVTDTTVIPVAAVAGVPVRIASLRMLPAERSPFSRCMLRASWRLSHAVVANSEFTASLIPTHVERVAVIRNFIDASQYAPRRTREESRIALGLPKDAFIVAILAALRPEKDHATFLQAAARVAHLEPQARFLVIGDGPERTRLEELRRSLGLLDRVRFVGYCRDVAEWLSAVDVTVLPSKAESLSNSVLESMAAARPVIATRVGGLAEVVEHGGTGFLVAPGDVEELSARMMQLASQPTLRQEMGYRARARIVSEYNCADMIGRLEALYDDLLAFARPLNSPASPRLAATFN